MSLSVVLIAYHSDAWISECLRSLVSGSNSRLHLILVDNSGNSKLADQNLGDFDIEVLKTPEPMGFAEANNYALTKAARLEDVILFLNQDTISPAGWIDECLNQLAVSAERGVVSPLIQTYAADDWDPSFLDCLSEDDKKSLGNENIGDGRGWLEVGHVPAPSMLVKKSVLLQVGPFDPIYGSYYEDYDLCHRIRAAGYEIGFATRSRIQHFSGSSTDTDEKVQRRMRQIIRNRLIYRSRTSSNSRTKTMIAYFLLQAPRNVLRGLAGRPGSQPVMVTMKAMGDIFSIMGRLMSENRDAAEWERYLDSIGWRTVE